MSDTKKELDELLSQIQIEVARQLALRVAEGEDLKLAIDFLKNNKRSLPEGQVVDAGGNVSNAEDYMATIIEELEGKGR